MSEEEIQYLIRLIDHHHGNELKDRDDASIDAEVREIQEFLKSLEGRR